MRTEACSPRPESSAPRPAPGGDRDAAPLRRLAVVLTVVAVVYAPWLVALIRFALGSELFSYVLLVPFVSGYFAWHARRTLPRATPAWGVAAPALVAAALLATAGLLLPANTPAADRLCYRTASFVLAVFAATAGTVGAPGIRRWAFPLTFLVFLVPLPTAATAALESALQHWSAAMASVLFRLAGTSVFIDEVAIKLPGFNMEVAPECSGIHSTLALFVTSVVAARLFLRRGWSRALLLALVIPLGVVRNGLRILVIGELCVHVGPEMINSYIHRHGGPVFFAVSLIPLLALLYALPRLERRLTPTTTS